MQFETQVAKALEHTLEQVLPTLPVGASIFFLRAQALPFLLNNKSFEMSCCQTFKPWSDKLEAQGFENNPEWPSANFDLVLYLPTRFKQENLYNFARLSAVLKPAGILLSAAHNKLGARSYENALQELFGDLQSFSAHHCRVSLVKNGPGLNAELLQQWSKIDQPQLVPGTGLFSSAACFSAQEVDSASLLLSSHLPSTLGARGADLGAGYGYLSDFILQHAAGVQELALYEAEYEALSCARENLARLQTPTKLSFQWHDVTQGLLHEELDWIVMNPPLHDLSKAQAQLGPKFIQAAHAALKKDGNMYIVFNAHLPYQKLLNELFRSVKLLGENKSFKVITAKK